MFPLLKLLFYFVNLYSMLHILDPAHYCALIGFSQGVEGHGGLKSGAVLDYCGVNRLDGSLTVTVYYYLPTLYLIV